MEHANTTNRLFWKNLGIRWLFVISVMTSLMTSHEITAQEMTWLHKAVGAKDFDLVKRLIDNGHQIEARSYLGLTPLMIAARFSSTSEIIQLLIEKGANALAKCKAGKKAIDYAKENKKQIGTQAYWNLNNKSFE